MFNEHPNCFMGKLLDSLNVQWTCKLFHGKITWFPKCSMNIQLVLEKSLDSLNVQWKSKLFHGKITYFPKMFNENSNCFMDKSLDSLTVEWTCKLFDGKTAWFPKCSMNIQIVPWKNYLTPSMFNEHANCFMDKWLNFLDVQWASNLFHGQITDFPKCSKNIEIVWRKNYFFPKC